MKLAKFTPGPWKVDVTKITSDSLIICSMQNYNPKTDEKHFFSEMGQANAKLIAAAPDMYAVLDETSNRLAYLMDLYELPEEAVSMLRGEIDNIMATMKKATEL